MYWVRLHQEMKSCITIIMLVGVSVICRGQENSVKVWLQSSSVSNPPKIDISHDLNTNEAVAAAKEEVVRLRDEGYLLANLDSVKVDANVTHLHLSVGEKFTWLRIANSNLPADLVSDLNLNTQYLRGEAVSVRNLANIRTKIIEHGSTTGYPFATFQLDSLNIKQGLVSATLAYDQGPFITFDSLEIIGDVRVQKIFLANFLAILPGQPYNEAVLETVEAKINQLPYLKQVEPLQVRFQNERATVALTLENQQANYLNGIVGFLPRERGGDKLLITGQVDLMLTNLFGRGKSLMVNWQSTKPQSQVLNLAYNHPYVAGSRLNLSSSFSLLKEDTTFINIRGRLAFDFKPQFGQAIGMYVESFSGRQGSASQSTGLGLPPVLDINNTTYGLTYSLNTLNHQLFPTRGISLGIDVGAGSKRIKPTPEIDPSVVSTIDLKSVQYITSFSLQRITPISARHLLFTRLTARKLFNDQLLLNDLFRLGGAQSLRGFNENEFFSSEYAFATIEWRILSQEQTYFFLFYDQAVTRQKTTVDSITDTPFGIGAGLTLATRSGVLNVTYALGSSQRQKFSPEFSKFHFGYVAKF